MARNFMMSAERPPVYQTQNHSFWTVAAAVFTVAEAPPEELPFVLRAALRGSPRLIWALRRPFARFSDAFYLAASLISMWLFTPIAPAVLAIRVAAPLCWITSVLPSIVATPPCTLKWNLSAPIFDLAILARIVASICASVGRGGPLAVGGVARWCTAVAGRACWPATGTKAAIRAKVVVNSMFRISKEVAR